MSTDGYQYGIESVLKKFSGIAYALACVDRESHILDVLDLFTRYLLGKSISGYSIS